MSTSSSIVATHPLPSAGSQSVSMAPSITATSRASG